MNRRKFNEPFVKIDVDRVKYMPDRKVENLLERYKLKRRTANRAFHKDLEEEICYIYREHEIRRRRKKAHEEFLEKKNQRRAKSYKNSV